MIHHLCYIEIMRVSSMVHDHGFSDFDRRRFRSPSPMSSPIVRPNLHGNGFGPWNGIPQERLVFPPPGTSMDWQGAPPSPGSYIVKKIIRLEVPVDSYPNFNFVGRILGPRGNSLKRVEASTGCRVFIRGKGSIKDTEKVTKMLYFIIISHLCACVISGILSLERYYSLLDQGSSLTYLM